MTGCPGVNPNDETTTFTVTYHGNGSDGGTVPTDSTEYEAGQTVIILNTGTMTRSSYSFVEWNTAAGGSGNAYSADDTLTMPSNDVDLYAQWILQNGTIDTSFGSNGVAVFNDDTENNMDQATAMVVTDSGEIYVSGFSYATAGPSRILILKYDTDGSYDTGYGDNGVVLFNDPSGSDGELLGYGTVLDSSGRIIVAGSYGGELSYDIGIIRFSSTGVWDESFGISGYVIVDGSAGGSDGEDDAYSILRDASGNLYITGESANASGNGDMVICKYDSDGGTVTSFGTNGTVAHDSAAGGSGYDCGNRIAADSSGNIYVFGQSSNGADDDMVVWKYDNAGAAVTDFGDNGVVVLDNIAGGNAADIAFNAAIDSAGKINVVGYSSNGSDVDIFAIRLNPDGTLASEFADGGCFVLDNVAGGNGDDKAYGCDLDSSGNLYITGYSMNGQGNRDMMIIKLDSNGSLYEGFGTNGIILHDNAAGGNGNDVGRCIVVCSETEIYVCGYSIGVNGMYDSVVWKYK